MAFTGSSEPSVEELRRVVAMQREQVQSHAERIAALEAAVEAAGHPRIGNVAALEAPDIEEYEGPRASRAAFLKTAAAGAAGLAGASIVGWGGPERALAEPAADRAGIVGAWIVSIAYRSGPHRTRGLASFTPGGGFVGSVSAYEHAPAHPTPSRGTTLHGAWVANGGARYAVTAVRLHLDGHGTLLGVMTTKIAVTLAADNDAWMGDFTFTATKPDGRVFSRGRGSLHGSRIAPPW